MLGQLLHGSWRYFIACIAASLLFTAFELVIPQIIRVSVDSLIGSGPVKVAAARPVVQALGGVDYLRQNLWIPAVMMAGFGLLSALMRYCVNLYSAKAGETLVKTSRDLLYHHIQHLPWKWHMENPTGDIIQRCTSDVERIKTFFEEQFVSVFRMLAMIVFALVCMALMNWKLALVPAVLFPVIIIYSLLFHNSIRERFTACDESEGVLSTIAQENLTGVRVVRAFGREEYERQRFEAQNEDYTTLWVRLCRTLSDFWAVGDATACIQTMLVVVLGSLLCVRGEMTEGEFVSFAIYNTMSISPVRRLGRVISEMSKMGVSVSRIAEVLDAPCEQDKPGAAPQPMDGDIVFDHVSFRYETGPDVLSDVSFTIPAGKSFGILGGTGSGKSSSRRLLLPSLCALRGARDGRRRGSGRSARGVGARPCRCRAAGAVFVLPHDRGEHRHLRRGPRGRVQSRRDGLHRRRYRAVRRRLPDHGRRARRDALRRTEAARGHRAHADEKDAHYGLRRFALRRRHPDG